MQKKKIVSLIVANALIFNFMGSNVFIEAEPVQSNISSVADNSADQSSECLQSGYFNRTPYLW